jgi:6-pyruvoyltetrahydropterin/6-carboxytetrahydropterin synthase
MPEQYELRIRKEALKFSASHMTVFTDGSKEALHGHQYQPSLTVVVKDANFENLVPFSRFKDAMRKIAALWDEKVLLATRNPFYEKIRTTRSSHEFKLCGKRYVIPTDETVLLGIDNVTCEGLARAYFEFLRAEMDEWFDDPNLISCTVLIEEAPGQGAAYTYVQAR